MDAHTSDVVSVDPDTVEEANKVPRVRIKNLTPDKNDKMRSELAFNVEWDDPEDGKTKAGLFRAKRPNIGMWTSIKVMEARLNSGQEGGLPGEVLVLHRSLAYCHYMLIEAPTTPPNDWWKPAEFFDAEPLEKVYEHVRHWESSFRKKGMGQ